MGITQEHNVIVRFKAISKGFGNITKRVKANVKDVDRVVGASNKGFQKMTTKTNGLKKSTRGASTAMGRFAHRMRFMTAGFRGFRMEMLGVMFFGMAIQRMFTGLLKPSAELVGIFDLFRITLQVLFLPIMVALLPLFVSLMEFFINLSPATKKLIGIFVLVAIGIGLLLFIVGTLALGIGSIILLFSQFVQMGASIGGMAGGVIAAIMGIGVALGIGKIAFKLWDTFVAPIIEKIKTKFQELGIGEKILQEIGIELQEGESLFGALKRRAGEFFDEFLEKIGISEEDIKKMKDTLGELKPSFDEIKTNFKNAWDEIKKGFDDSNFKLSDIIVGFILIAISIAKLTPLLVDLLPPLTEVMEVLAKIVIALAEMKQNTSLMGGFFGSIAGKFLSGEGFSAFSGESIQASATSAIASNTERFGNSYFQSTYNGVLPENLDDKFEENNKKLYDQIIKEGD